MATDPDDPDLDPPDFSMFAGFTLLNEEGERIAAELRGGGPPPVHRPMPRRWEWLRNKINLATVMHTHDGSRPLYKIGHFDAVICCGRGGYGLVFEVFDPRLQRRCALKLCEVGEHQTADDVLAEARLLASLSHPNIIAVYETGWYGEYPFFVMEYATGKTAHHFALDFEGDEPPPWQEIVDIYLGAGRGLAWAHEAPDGEIIHGDFKPSNVLIDEGGARPRVADFGFSRRRLAHTPEHERDAVRVRGGTLFYAAPETLRGEACDARSDQYSFCASLWHSLEGTLPFDAESTDRMLETIEQTEPQRLNPAVPETLRTVLECGLSEDPRDRFASMGELLRALELVRQTAVTPVQAPMSADDELALMLRRPRRRRRGSGRGFPVLWLLVGGLSVFVAMRGTQEPARDGEAVPPTAEPTTPASECAIEPGESIHPDLREAVVGVCRKIRDGEFRQASSDWEPHYHPDDDAVADATLIIARTFVDVAESLGNPEQARDAAEGAERWAGVLGHEHAGGRAISKRAAPFLRD